MKFVDEAKIYIKAGHGGKGCVSFRREKFVPKGGPDGGDGGKGGDVIFRATESHHTLLDLKYNQHQIAKNGGHGSGNHRTGKSAEDLEITVPVGTIIKAISSPGSARPQKGISRPSCKTMWSPKIDGTDTSPRAIELVAISATAAMKAIGRQTMDDFPRTGNN